MNPHTNVSKVANFFFAAAFGLVVTAQWELSVGNGFAYTVFSAFGELPSPLFEIQRKEGCTDTNGQGCSTRATARF
jgi:succinate-acetate transporter protein